MPVPTTAITGSRSPSMSPSPMWEEPHPGQRMNCSSPAAHHGKGYGNQDQRSNSGGIDTTVGVYDDDADTMSPEYDDISGQISDDDGPLGIMMQPTISNEFVEHAPDSRCVSQSSLTIRTVDIHLDEGKLDTMDLDLDRCPSSPATVNLTPTAMNFADVSNYFHDSHMDGQVATHFVYAEADFARYAAPNDDVYGWNAEWQRRSDVSPVSNENVKDTAPRHRSLRNSRLRGHKGALLKKVFSVSKTPSSTTVSRHTRAAQ